MLLQVFVFTGVFTSDEPRESARISMKKGEHFCPPFVNSLGWGAA
jgi:hypothetical protein